MASLDLIQGRYRVLQELSRGGMSFVYLARDEQLHGRPVVVKILKEGRAEEWLTKKFKQEIEALARINHPGVVGLLDAGQMEDGRLFVVVQFVEGVTLRAILIQQHGPLGFGLSARIIEQMGEALAAAHNNGVLHCDLKPENIMIQTSHPGEETVKLIDFGIAKIRDSKVSSPATTQVAGTVQYMAPEQLQGTPSVATDIFALGVIAYEMLAGETPFPARNILELFTMHKNGIQKTPRDLRPDLPETADAIILKALSIDPAERQSKTVEFTRTLADVLRKNAPLKPVFTTESWPVIKRSRTILLILSVILVLVSVAGIIRETMRKSRTSSATQTPAPPKMTPSKVPALPGNQVELQYWMMVRREGKGEETPFRLAKEINFESDDRIQLHIRAKQNGWIYILNEGPELLEKKSQFVVLFPSTLDVHHSAMIEKDHEIRVPGNGWYIFDQEKETEKIWIIFSIQPVSVLESVKPLANPDEIGIVSKPAQMDALGSFFQGFSLASVTLNSKEQFTVLKMKGTILIHQILLEHH